MTELLTALGGIGKIGSQLGTVKDPSPTSLRPEGQEAPGKATFGAAKPKIRKPSAQMQKMFPVLAKEANPQFAKAATGFTYTTETIFTLFSALMLIQLFVTNPKLLIGMNGAKAVAMLTVFIMSAYSIYQGHSVPEVHISYYMAELLVVLALNISVLVINSINLAKKRKRGKATTAFDVFGILVPAGFTAFNTYLLGQQLYRLKLGKRMTPVSQIFTMTMSGFVMIMSINNMRTSAVELRRLSKNP